ncbi:hypothetical protein MTP99_007515 [Tenebrio molitor]|nr:hypothetical protein MTP99_007515 [Tenebrio molitor]
MVSLKAIQHIWQYAKSKGMVFLRGRVLNQDALENLFSLIRSGCGSSDNPTPVQFIGSLKTQVLNGLANQSLKNSNCEDDDSHLLSNLRTFLTVENDSVSNEEEQFGITPLPTHDARCDVVASDVAAAVALGTTVTLSVAYVSGFIARRIVKEVAGCQSCVSCLCSSSLEAHNLFIVNKEWSDDDTKLTYPSESLVVAVGVAVSLLENFLHEHKSRPHVLSTGVFHMKSHIDFSWVSCTNHREKIIDCILKGVARMGIPWWCNRQNQPRLRERKDTRAEKTKLKKMAHKRTCTVLPPKPKTRHGVFCDRTPRTQNQQWAEKT